MYKLYSFAFLLHWGKSMQVVSCWARVLIFGLFGYWGFTLSNRGRRGWRPARRCGSCSYGWGGWWVFLASRRLTWREGHLSSDALRLWCWSRCCCCVWVFWRMILIFWGQGWDCRCFICSICCRSFFFFPFFYSYKEYYTNWFMRVYSASNTYLMLFEQSFQYKIWENVQISIIILQYLMVELLWFWRLINIVSLL